jgi:hypothetical protein
VTLKNSLVILTSFDNTYEIYVNRSLQIRENHGNSSYSERAIIGGLQPVSVALPGSYYFGLIYEFIIYGKPLFPEDRALVEDYIQNKYNFQLPDPITTGSDTSTDTGSSTTSTSQHTTMSATTSTTTRISASTTHTAAGKNH